VSFQVLVKTTAVMNGAYTFLLPDRESALEFARRPDVWWYHFPEDDDDWRWHRGGAWKPAQQIVPEDIAAEPAPPGPAAQPGAVEVSEDDDDRW
jgi:hypothetical protein